MGNAITQDSRALWIMLRNDGAWWTVNALVHHWHPTFYREELQALLDALVKGRFVEQRGQFNHPIYCVTTSCLPLPGLSLTSEATR